jgi:hypothetical protein
MTLYESILQTIQKIKQNTYADVDVFICKYCHDVGNELIFKTSNLCLECFWKQCIISSTYDSVTYFDFDSHNVYITKKVSYNLETKSTNRYDFFFLGV